MPAVVARIFDGKKFLWDGKEYGAEDAKRTAESYRKNNFEVEVVNEAGKYLVFTRRVVKEVKVEGSPPPGTT